MSKLKDYDQLIQRRRSLLFYQNRKKTILYNGVKLVKGEDQILDLRKGRNFEREIDNQYNASIVLHR